MLLPTAGHNKHVYKKAAVKHSHVVKSGQSDSSSKVLMCLSMLTAAKYRGCHLPTHFKGTTLAQKQGYSGHPSSWSALEGLRPVMQAGKKEKPCPDKALVLLLLMLGSLVS